MTQVGYEIRPLKNDAPLITFEKREQALDWMERCKKAIGYNVPMRLVWVEKHIIEIYEEI